MFPKVDFKPKDRRKVTLFANKGEAIVFWLSFSGLIFLIILFIFRFFSERRSDLDYQNIQTTQKEILLKIKKIEQQNEIYKQQIDSLRSEINRMEGESGQEKK